jgi:sterol 3beta-glucosyltransferase
MLAWRMARKEVNAFRASLGLHKAKGWPNVLRLHAISPQLIPQPPDWDDLAKITGFITLPIKPEAPPQKVQQWIEEGEAPVYVGLGSIPAPDPVKFEKVITALLGEFRVLFCKGWSEMTLSPDPNLCIVDKIDHRWLFPRCRAAVIHGGVGTMAAALGAGTPPIILSVFADQPWWGRMVERRGLGVHIPFKRLTPEGLLGAVKSVGQIKPLKDEDGVGTAISALSEYFMHK